MPQDATNSHLVSIAEIEDSLSDVGQVESSFRLEGVVRAVVPRRNILAVQDASAAMLLELPSLNSTVGVGDRLAIEADHCVLTRTRFGARVSAFLVANNDGIHSRQEASGKVFLNAGMNPIRVEWFNGPGEFALDLEYEGPDTERQRVPNALLWYCPNGKSSQNNLRQGLHYEAYEGTNWTFLPDFSWLDPVAEDVATNFSASYRCRDEYCGLVFDGFIQVRKAGVYTFYVASDDGSRMYAGKPSVSCGIVAPAGAPVPAPDSFEQALVDSNSRHWVEMEGEVTFVSENQRGLEMQMLAGGNDVPVTVLDGGGLFSTNLLHRWIQVDGICKFSGNAGDKRLAGVFVPGSAQVRIYDSTGGIGDLRSKDLLTTTAQIRRLKPDEAGRHIPARIRGVVIYSSSSAVVLEGAGGGVFIGSRDGQWAEQPAVGELWEMQGVTDPGDFSPVVVSDKAIFLGYGRLPEPIQPTRDQLMNGNLDAEYAELHGVVASVSSNEISLLTPDGKVTVVGNEYRPLPQLPKSVPGGGALAGSVVRIRGCFATQVDLRSRQVTPGRVYIYPALVEVEDPAPVDPFQLPTRTPSDLTWFNARSIALQRTKLAGQIIHVLPGEYFVLDGNTGIRALVNDSRSLETGDLIEAVGFPKLGGPSPVLQEAQVRKRGHAALSAAIRVPSERLLDRSLDSTLVEVEATLISDTLHQGERVLELQNGARHFVARIRVNPQAPALLPAGCRLKLDGVYASADEDPGYIGAAGGPFELLLNSNAGIVILQWPSWWTVRRTIMLVAGLAGLLCVAFIWVALLRRQVEERTAQLKTEIEERQLVEQHHAIERERTRVARDLHDELGAGLTEVSILGSLANTPAVLPEARHRYLDQITGMARSLVTSLDEIVWAVNPNYDSLGSLVSYFSLFAESFLGLAGITCRLRVADDLPECPLDAKQRHGVFCAFKEALNNVIRHSHATEVRIAFEAMAGKLVLTIADNGCGFEFAAGAPGKDGLAGLSQRMEQFGGGCDITSHVGKGTKVEIHLPLSETRNDQSRSSRG